MRRDGSLETESILKDFSLGFTQGAASFDFVDIGYGKERADHKIKGTGVVLSVPEMPSVCFGMHSADTQHYRNCQMASSQRQL